MVGILHDTRQGNTQTIGWLKMHDSEFPIIDLQATGRRIEMLMKANGYCVKDLQVYFGFGAPQAVYKWLWGKNLPGLDNLMALSRLFNTPMDDILVEKGHDPEQTNRQFFQVREVRSSTVYYFINYKFNDITYP